MTDTDRDRIRLASVVFAVLLAQVLLYPGVPDLVAAVGATTALDASMWFLAAEFAAFVAFAGVWGAASDRLGRRTPLVAAGALGGAVGYFALAALPGALSLSFGEVLALRAVQGATTIGAFSLSMTMLMDLDGGHGKNMGAAGIAIGLGTAVGAPLGGQLYGVGALVPLYAAGCLLVVAGLVALSIPDRAPASGGRAVGADGTAPADGEAGGDDGHVRRALATLTERPVLGLPYVFGFVDRFTAGFFALVGTVYFQEAFPLDAAGTGIMLGLFFAPFALLQYPFGVLSDRVGRTGPIVAGSALYGFAVVGVGLAPTVPTAAVGMVVVGVIGALMSPATMALVSDLSPADGRGTAMAGFNAFGSVGFLAGILVGGTVADEFGFLAAFLTAGALEIAVAAVSIPTFLRIDPEGASAFGG
ncbi:MFS transporter [Halorussus gelatinilyticus]|uniref:MFS transporter n=1 Tax=Halorussus gelatinilyticus TaxID=2937524 RepID=A0A8U0IN95_9EURY|nr:MFS transporter [Halorussus gelatinilyticus]UPW02071.1 MFS transporter [Halorussus gelatinilyticus]